MNQPDLYARNNNIQKRDANYILANYLGLIRWKCEEQSETILDIGCGDGDVLLNILLPKLPKNFQKLYGIDISADFLDYASKSNSNNRIVFEKFDIASNQLPVKYCEQFDHIFSFYCLHWVLDQRKAIGNISKMLKPGGDMLLTFLASNPIYNIHEILAKTSEWSKYMYDVDKFISPYQHSKNPKVEMETLLKQYGLISLKCEVISLSCMFANFTSLAKHIESVNPFVGRLPNEQKADFIKGYLGEARNLPEFTIHDGDDKAIHMEYKLFVVVAVKPKKK